MNELDELVTTMTHPQERTVFDISEMVDLSLASTICQDESTMFEVRADVEYVTVCIYSASSERKITMRNKWGVTDVFYYHPASILKNAQNCKTYIDLATGNIFCTHAPMKHNAFDTSKL